MPEMHDDLHMKYENGIAINEAEEVIRAIVDGTWDASLAGHEMAM